MKVRLVFVTLAAAMASACVTVPGPGAQEGETPPKIIVKDNAKTWDNPTSFGPVPELLATKGAATCAKLNTDDAKFIAGGYHSKAQDVDGKPFPGGGFYCIRG